MREKGNGNEWKGQKDIEKVVEEMLKQNRQRSLEKGEDEKLNGSETAEKNAHRNEHGNARKVSLDKPNGGGNSKDGP